MNSLVALAGSTDGLVLLSHSGTGAVTWGQVSSGGIAAGAVQVAGVSGVLGTWVDKSGSYGAQQAATDGFIIAYSPSEESINEYIEVYTDANANPTTLRTKSGTTSGTTSFKMSIFCPVKKNDYWKIITNVTITAYWIPLGA